VGETGKREKSLILSEEITVCLFHFPFIVSSKEHGAEETVAYFA
jgi:hypothetical protein